MNTLDNSFDNLFLQNKLFGSRNLFEFRFDNVKNVSYDLILNCNDNSDKYFHGNIHVILITKHDVYLDYKGVVLEIIINDKKIKNIVHKNNLIKLDKKYFNIDKSNNIIITFKSKFNNNSTGMNLFSFENDLEKYLYSNCEPFYMHNIIPCFDQPDIKAPIKVNFIIDKNWTSISNTPVEKIYNYNNLTISSHFTTPLLSPYVYSFIVGDYKTINMKRGVFISCRKMLYNSVYKIKDKIYDIVVNTIDFYEKFLSVKYPYETTGIIFCPQISDIYAMENPGSIVFNEMLICHHHLEETIMHELAHMWFGNLVTLKWWYELWLNEGITSFVTLLCYLSVNKHNKNKISLFKNEIIKQKYQCIDNDNRISTDPIICYMKDMNEGRNAFNCATYRKGSFILYQLMEYNSPKTFKKFLSKYVKTYQNSNVTISDFKKIFTSVLPDNDFNNNWISHWLYENGSNTVSCKWHFNDNVLSVEVLQSSQKFKNKVLRYHILNLDIYTDTLIPITKKIIIENKEKNNFTFVFNNKPQAVCLRNTMGSFVKIIIDNISMSFLSLNYDMLENNIKFETQFLIKNTLKHKTDIDKNNSETLSDTN